MTQAVRSAHSFAQNANVWSTRQVAIEPVTEAQARIARQAYRDFGKTSGHPAKLNFGDCFSYALAKAKGEPLLFKGQDFSRTDVKSARA
jgi:ribonuclease VapC